MNPQSIAQQMLLDADIYLAACLIAVHSERFGNLRASDQLDQSKLVALAKRVEATSAFRSSVNQLEFERPETFEFIVESRSRVIELIGLLLNLAIAEEKSNPDPATEFPRWLGQERALLEETESYQDLPQKYATLNRCGWTDGSSLKLQRIDELLLLAGQATNHYRPTREGIQASHLLHGLLACIRRLRNSIDNFRRATDGCW
jgi:hypothetical protein